MFLSLSSEAKNSEKGGATDGLAPAETAAPCQPYMGKVYQWSGPLSEETTSLNHLRKKNQTEALSLCLLIKKEISDSSF